MIKITLLKKKYWKYFEKKNKTTVDKNLSAYKLCYTYKF